MEAFTLFLLCAVTIAVYAGKNKTSSPTLGLRRPTPMPITFIETDGLDTLPPSPPPTKKPTRRPTAPPSPRSTPRATNRPVVMSIEFVIDTFSSEPLKIFNKKTGDRGGSEEKRSFTNAKNGGKMLIDGKSAKRSIKSLKESSKSRKSRSA